MSDSATPVSTSPQKKIKASKKPGYLNVNSSPWTTVYINGREVGDIPIIKHELPAGRYKVTLLNNEYKIRKTFYVEILPGKVTPLIKNFQ